MLFKTTEAHEQLRKQIREWAEKAVKQGNNNAKELLKALDSGKEGAADPSLLEQWRERTPVRPGQEVPGTYPGATCGMSFQRCDG